VMFYNINSYFTTTKQNQIEVTRTPKTLNIKLFLIKQNGYLVLVS
jgi:hypothetical protein